MRFLVLYGTTAAISMKEANTIRKIEELDAPEQHLWN